MAENIPILEMQDIYKASKEQLITIVNKTRDRTVCEELEYISNLGGSHRLLTLSEVY